MIVPLSARVQGRSANYFELHKWALIRAYAQSRVVKISCLSNDLAESISYNFSMALGNGGHTSITDAPQLETMTPQELRRARQEQEVRQRRSDLTVPLSPRLVIPSVKRWANIPDVHKVFIPVPATPAPLSDMERRDEMHNNPHQEFKITQPQAVALLEAANVVFDKGTGHWKHVNSRGDMSAVNVPLYFYRIKGFIDIATHGVPRYEGSLIAAELAVEDRATKQVDPEEYLEKYSGDVRAPQGAAVIGIDRDSGDVRVDIASISAVRHYFELD